MACWYFDKKDLRNTPSFINDIDYATESKYRQEGAKFISSAGTKMDLGYNTIATGTVFFHRFYMFHSFREFPRYMTACCCLFLAGKVEETPKKARDIISTAQSLLSEDDFATLGKSPRDELMVMEKILLQTIKFDFQVEHPYQYLLKYAKCLKGDKAKLQKMVQMAWTFVNDSLCTTLSLQWEPEVVAIALMYLAGKLSKFEVIDWTGRTPNHLFWWDQYVEDVTISHLDDICHQVLDLYSSPQAAKSTKSAAPRRVSPKRIPVITSAVPSSATPVVAPVTPVKVPTDPFPMSAKMGKIPVVEPRLPVEEVKLPLDLPPPPPPPPMLPGFPTGTYNALGYPPVFPPTAFFPPP